MEQLIQKLFKKQEEYRRCFSLNTFSILFYSAIFMAFGVGVTLAQIIQNLPDGIYFIFLGFFIGLIGSIFYKYLEKIKSQ